MRISEHIGTVFALYDPRILDPTRPLSFFLAVLGREEDGSSIAVEVDAILTLRQSKAGSMAADLVAAGIILRTI